MSENSSTLWSKQENNMYDSKENIIKRALTILGNVHPSLFDVIVKEMIELNLNTNSVHVYKRYIINRFKYKHRCFNFFIERGWNETEIFEIMNNSHNFEININKQLDKFKHLTSERRQEVYDELIGLKNVGHDVKAVRKLVTRALFGEGTYPTPFQKEHFMCLGHSEEEAKSKISKMQIKSNNKRAIKLSENPELYDSNNTNQLKYWLKKGYSEEEARQKVKDRQSTFSLEKCIAKYGETEGFIVFNKRQEKWQNSLVNNPNYSEICKSRGKSYEYFVVKYGEERAREIVESRNRPFSFGRASKESLQVFIPLYKWLRKNKIIERKSVFLGVGGSKEYFIKNDTYVNFYDFTLPQLNIMIEFNGIAYHPRTRSQKTFNHVFNEFTCEKLYDDYEDKKELAKNGGFSLLVIWSDESVENNLSLCKDFILETIKQ